MNDNENLTQEELQQLVIDAGKREEDLTAERDSLKEELQTAREELNTLKQELLETKKLNYTLGRKLDISGKKESAEDILAGMMKEKERR